MAGEDHSKANCLVIVVMTHGEGTDVDKQKLPTLYAFDQGYQDAELWKPFLGNVCPTLRGKPKWIIIQVEFRMHLRGFRINLKLNCRSGLRTYGIHQEPRNIGQHTPLPVFNLIGPTLQTKDRKSN